MSGICTHFSLCSGTNIQKQISYLSSLYQITLFRTQLASPNGVLSTTKRNEQQQQLQDQCNKSREKKFSLAEHTYDPYGRPYATMKSYKANCKNTYIKQFSTQFSQQRGAPLMFETKVSGPGVRRQSDASDFMEVRPVVLAAKVKCSKCIECSLERNEHFLCS